MMFSCKVIWKTAQSLTFHMTINYTLIRLQNFGAFQNFIVSIINCLQRKNRCLTVLLVEAVGFWTHVQEYFRRLSPSAADTSWNSPAWRHVSSDYTITIPLFPYCHRELPQRFPHNRRQIRYLQVTEDRGGAELAASARNLVICL